MFFNLLLADYLKKENISITKNKTVQLLEIPLWFGKRLSSIQVLVCVTNADLVALNMTSFQHYSQSKNVTSYVCQQLEKEEVSPVHTTCYIIDELNGIVLAFAKLQRDYNGYIIIDDFTSITSMSGIDKKYFYLCAPILLTAISLLSQKEMTGWKAFSTPSAEDFYSRYEQFGLTKSTNIKNMNTFSTDKIFTEKQLVPPELYYDINAPVPCFSETFLDYYIKLEVITPLKQFKDHLYRKKIAENISLTKSPLKYISNNQNGYYNNSKLSLNNFCFQKLKK